MNQELTVIPLDKLNFDDENNSRGQILPLNVMELAKSILDSGLQQPIVVCPEGEDGKHIVVMGYRRCHAHKRLVREGHEQFNNVKAIINHELSGANDMKFKVLNLTENLHRQDLNMLEEAKALKWFQDQGMTQEAVAEAIDMSRGWVQERYMLLRMPEEVQFEAALGWISSPLLRRLYTIFKKRGKLALYEAVRKAKEQKQRGETIKIGKAKRDPLRKRKANETEIRGMRDLIYNKLGPEVYNDEAEQGACWMYTQVATRALSWAIGDISDYDLFATLKAIADKTGYEIEMPELD